MENWSNFNLEKILGVPLEEFDTISDNIEGNVHEFDIQKRNGKKRHIIAPGPRLKYILKGIGWRILSAYKPHRSAHGFQKNKSIKTNAMPHVGSNAVGSIDVKDFFPSVNEKHLNNILLGNKRICKMCKNYNGMCSGYCHPSIYHNRANNYPHKCEEIKAILIPDFCEKTGYQSLLKRVINVCIYKDHTPQGFPTSPMLANLALRGLDIMMERHCNKHNIRYTRYADDLCFSTMTDNKRTLKDKTLGVATSLLRKFGFAVNKKKTKYRSRAARLLICNVVVNDKLSLAKYRVKIFRAEVHHATVKNKDTTTKRKIRELKGFASFLKSINETVGSKYMTQLISFERMRNDGDSWPARVD